MPEHSKCLIRDSAASSSTLLEMDERKSPSRGNVPNRQWVVWLQTEEKSLLQMEWIFQCHKKAKNLIVIVISKEGNC
jgi:hypothetical protein